MKQVLIGRIERVVDSEILGAREDSPGDINISAEITGIGT
jgi:hypothetical protein